MVRATSIAQVLLTGCALLSGCAASIPPAGWAREQPPVAATPAGAWRSTAGRCLLTTPLSRLSCRLLVRHTADDLRLTMLADEGPVLLDLSCAAGRVTVHGGHPDLLPRAPTIAALALSAWGPLPTGTPRWTGDHWELPVDGGTVHLGGDPLLPRTVARGVVDHVIGDYRWTPGGILAHRVSLDAPGIELTLQLGADAAGPAAGATLRDGAAPRPSAPP